MTQVYSDPNRESDAFALPNIEVWYHDGEYECLDNEGNELEHGWYWWPSFAGCLPDGDAIGPFETEQEAIDDAQDY